MILSSLRRPEVPIGIAFIIGMIVTFEYFATVPTLTSISMEFQKWGTILVTFTMTISSANLLLIHGKNISQRKSAWPYSVLLIISFAFMMVLGIWSGFFTKEGLLHPYYNFMVREVQYPINVSMYGLLGFYIVSAAYRAFRARGIDATLVLVAGAIVMLGQAPIGEVIWNQFPNLRQWIMNVPTVAGSRALILGTSIGAFSMAIRVLLGYERGWLGRGGGGE